MTIGYGAPQDDIFYEDCMSMAVLLTLEVGVHIWFTKQTWIWIVVCWNFFRFDMYWNFFCSFFKSTGITTIEASIR